MMKINNFTITQNASERILELSSKNTHCVSRMRITVEGGGCSGFKYKYEMTTDEPGTDDLVFKNGDAEVMIDSTSFEFLENSEVDYIKNLGGEYFEIRNPNAASGCGCGNSFSI